ncbi:fimbrial protein [Dyella sp.]|jgi:major type 1 subunit fimbrin (pilin)|uniref:fimbrial protein n=1 Tax=Dyella sp. TaxID=1869338 RepID=UPI002D76A832|nr:fimbrial protein [Dyella sp.]HET6431367.1 fimbrial protein [Dyella sp.]
MLTNKTLLSTAMVAAFGVLASAPIHAANSGTINITGKVLADTCTVSVNGNSGTTVALPTVMTAAFGSAAGTVAGATAFSVSLAGCDTNTTSAKMAFSGANVDTSTGNLKNATSGGSNVQIQLLNSSDAAINTSTQAGAPTINVTSGNGSTAMKAQYISTAATTTPGLVSSSVSFTLTYL